MKRLALALSLAFAFGTLTSAADTVPFKATIHTAFTQPAPCGGPIFCLQISGDGQATHFGLVGMDGPSQLNFATLVQTGTFTLTAADGSTLVIHVLGHFLPGPGGVTFEGVWESISGTGRFEGESARGTYAGSASDATGQGTLRLDGRMSNPGK